MSRRAQKLIMVLCSMIVGVVVWYDHSRPHFSGQSSASSRQQSFADDFTKYHTRVFTVVKVVDGDTLDINLPDGKYKTTRIRLLGVDTPETVKPNAPVMHYGTEASAFAKKTAMHQQVTILLDQISPTRDKFGRLLAYIKLPDGRILNEVLIKEGYGYADLRFKHSFFKSYAQLMYKAQKNKIGLWKEVRFDQLPPWLQREQPDILKKAA